MKNWFYNPEVDFQMWGMTHILTIAFILITFTLFFIKRNKIKLYREPIRMTVGCLLILSRISLDIWYVTTEQWSVTSSLPLELCSIASLLCGVMLLTKSRFLVEIFYFIGIGGAAMAVLTPDLYFGFPQYRFLQFFIDHFLLMSAPLIMIFLYNYRITRASLVKAFVSLNVIAAVVFIINNVLSANYMFLRHKPNGASLLDLLGPYPYYLLSLEAITLIFFFILYVPFIIKRHMKNKHNP